MKLSFTKMQGCANDYIYLDCRTLLLNCSWGSSYFKHGKIRLTPCRNILSFSVGVKG